MLATMSNNDTPGTMHRTQIYLPHVQLDWLREQAAARGITMSEFLRRLIDAVREAS